MAVYKLSSSYDDPATGVVGEARNTLSGGMTRVRHAVMQIGEADLWWRPHDAMNAPGNILLHLHGNLSQWILAGVGGEPYGRDRDAEFAATGGSTLDELLARLDSTVAKCDTIIAGLSAADLVRPTRIQGFDTTVIAAVIHAVSHLEGHAQELIYIARLRRGDDYAFLWSPKQIGNP